MKTEMLVRTMRQTNVPLNSREPRRSRFATQTNATILAMRRIDCYGTNADLLL